MKTINRKNIDMIYNPCGKSGLKLPAISLGLWHNFGDISPYDQGKELVKCAFEVGITHFDLANNYGPPPGSAEEKFGDILKKDFQNHRDEMVISTKAGYLMWPGTYGDGGTKKHLVASLDQSLRRMNLDYVDIFYHHRPDPETPLEETMSALSMLVRQGKALYVGISNYSPEQSKKAADLLKSMGTPCIIHQHKYSMLTRNSENGLLNVLEEEEIGSIAFSPLEKGLLTDRYLHGIPKDSRLASQSEFLKREELTEELMTKIKKLNIIANRRGQKLSQMAISWLLYKGNVTSALIGASKTTQILDAVASLQNLEFSIQELVEIDDILGGG